MIQSILQFTALTFLVAQLLTIAAAAQQRTVVFQNGTNGYNGTIDTMFAEIREEVPLADVNLSGSSVIGAGFDTANPDNGIAYAYIQFSDIIGNGVNQVPPGATITDAKIEMFVSDSSSDAVFMVLYNNLLDFDAATSTYTSMGGDVPLGLPFFIPANEPGSVFVEVPGQDDGLVWEADVAPLIQQYADGLANEGIWIIPDINFVNAISLVSTEGTFGPALDVVTPSRTYTFQQGLNGYTGLQDANIRGEDPDVAFGNEPFARIENDGAPDFKYALLRFDDIFGTAANQIPPGTPINNAVLKIAVVNAGGNSQILEILPHADEQFGVNTFFEEDTVTWNTFVDDAVGIQPGVEVGEEAVAELDLFGGSRVVDMDVTSTLQKWSDGTLQNFGWLIESQSTRNGAIATKEMGQFVPKLTVTFTGGQTSAIQDYELYQ